MELKTLNLSVVRGKCKVLISMCACNASMSPLGKDDSDSYCACSASVVKGASHDSTAADLVDLFEDSTDSNLHSLALISADCDSASHDAKATREHSDECHLYLLSTLADLSLCVCAWSGTVCTECDRP